MSSDTLVVYVTCGSLDEARRIGRAMVEERLAACANLRPHEAIYRWQGAIEQADEFGLLLKTTRDRFGQLEARIAALHSYTTPCIVAWPLTAGSAAFCQWVRDETGS
jgi:periplasmic divalent cation tolerance protein